MLLMLGIPPRQISCTECQLDVFPCVNRDIEVRKAYPISGKVVKSGIFLAFEYLYNVLLEELVVLRSRA